MSWTTVCEFRVDGIPKGQPRPRAFARNGHVRVYDPGTAEAWKSAIAEAARPHLPATPIEGPVMLTCHFEMPRPKRLMRTSDPLGPVDHLAKPDVDNLIKAISDSLTQIGMWRDDCQVAYLKAGKVYHGKNDRPGALVVVEIPN